MLPIQAPVRTLKKNYPDAAVADSIMEIPNMKKKQRRDALNPASEPRKTSKRRNWYFVRIGFIALPYEGLKRPNRGTFFQHYHLIEAKNIASAFKKAEWIIDVRENLTGEAKLRGRRMVYKRIGVLSLEPVCEQIVSGVELFDESQAGISESVARRRAISAARKRQMISYEKRHGTAPVLDVYWGEEFERL